MVGGILISSAVGFVVGIGLEAIKDKLKDSKDKEQLGRQLEEFAQRKFEEKYKNTQWDTNLDFDGLLKSVKKFLLNDIISYLTIQVSEEREDALSEILSRMKLKTNAERKLDNEAIIQLVMDAIEICEAFYREQMSEKDKIRDAGIVKSIHKNQQRDTEKIIKKGTEQSERILGEIADIKELFTPSKDILDREVLSKLKLCKSYFFGERWRHKNIETSELDELLLPLLKYILGDGDFSQFKLEDFIALTSKIHSNTDIAKLVSERWRAIELLQKGNKSSYLQSLELLDRTYKDNDSIPEWLKNDLRIDIRNIAFDLKSDYQQAQERIDLSKEDIHYPLVDRFDKISNQGLVDIYLRAETISPYTRTFGEDNFTRIYESNIDALAVAALFGSWTHIKLTNERIKKHLLMLNLRYTDADIFSKYLQMVSLNIDTLDKNALNNNLGKHYNLLSNAHAEKIFSSTSTVIGQGNRIKSRLFALRYIGAYLSDEDFISAKNTIFDDIKVYVKLENVRFRFRADTKDALLRNMERLDVNEVLDLLIDDVGYDIEELLSVQFQGFLGRWDYSQISENNINRIVCFISSLKQTQIDDKRRLEEILINIRHRLNANYHQMFDDCVKGYDENFFEVEYLAYTQKTLQSVVKFINEQLSATDSKLSSLDSSLSSGDGNELRQVLDILINLKDIGSMEISLINNILKVCKKTLERTDEKSFYQRESIRLVVFLTINFQQDEVVSVSKEILEIAFGNTSEEKQGNISVFDFDMHSVNVQIFYVTLLEMLLDNGVSDNAVDHLSTVGVTSKQDQIEVAGAIYFFVNQISPDQLKNLQNVDLFVFYILSNLDNAIVDAKYYYIRCIGAIAKKYDKYNEIILLSLYNLYDHSTPLNKKYIMKTMHQINGSDKKTLKLMERMKGESNFYLRKQAKSLEQE